LWGNGKLFIFLYLSSYILTEINSALDKCLLFSRLSLFCSGLCNGFSSRSSNFNSSRSSSFCLFSLLGLFVRAAECSQCNSYDKHHFLHNVI